MNCLPIFIKSGVGQVKVFASSIEYIEAKHDQCTFHLTDGNHRDINSSLSDALAKLPGCMFVQAHRSYVVNILAIDTLYPNQVKMDSGVTIPIGEKYRGPLREKIQTL